MQCTLEFFSTYNGYAMISGLLTFYVLLICDKKKWFDLYHIIPLWYRYNRHFGFLWLFWFFWYRKAGMQARKKGIISALSGLSHIKNFVNVSVCVLKNSCHYQRLRWPFFFLEHKYRLFLIRAAYNTWILAGSRKSLQSSEIHDGWYDT